MGNDFTWLRMKDRKGESHLYSEVEQATTEAVVSVYQTLATIGVFASGLAIIVAATLLIINAHSGGEKLADAKRYAVRVLIVSILIFGASGLVLMVESMGF